MRQSNAVITRDAGTHLGEITAPTQITFGQHDMVTPTRFADQMQAGIRGAELIVFEGRARALSMWEGG